MKQKIANTSLDIDGAVAFTFGCSNGHAAGIGTLAGLLAQSAVVLASQDPQARRVTSLPSGSALVTGWLLAVVFTA